MYCWYRATSPPSVRRAHVPANHPPPDEPRLLTLLPPIPHQHQLPAGFRDFPLGDLPMLEVLRQASEGVFVPLTVGGGIREFTDASGKHYSALQVAAEYFRCVDSRRAWHRKQSCGCASAGQQAERMGVSRGMPYPPTHPSNPALAAWPDPAPAQVWR